MSRLYDLMEGAAPQPRPSLDRFLRGAFVNYTGLDGRPYRARWGLKAPHVPTLSVYHRQAESRGRHFAMSRAEAEAFYLNLDKEAEA